MLIEYIDEFNSGLTIISKLTAGETFVCHDENFKFKKNEIAKYQAFGGKHPAGLAGTHIHHLDPVGLEKHVWSIDYQDVIAIGKLFTTGKIYSDKIIALSGSQVANPRLLKVCKGSDVAELSDNELHQGNNHIVSGSVLDGTVLEDRNKFLRARHNQVCIIPKGDKREVLGWYNWWGLKEKAFHTAFISSKFI